MHRAPLVLPVLVALFLAGCVVTSHTYDVRRSALVPSLTTPMRSGRPIDGRTELATSLGTNLTSPDTEENDNANTHVARTTLGIATRFRVGRAFDIGPVFQVGFADPNETHAEGTAVPPRGPVLGTGVSMQLAPRFEDERFAFAGVFELVFLSVPLREEWWCMDCGGAPSLDRVENDHEAMPVFGLSLLPSFRPSHAWTFFGGVTVKNQPVVHGSETVVTTEVGAGDSERDLQMGPLNVVASLGAELAFGAGGHAMLVASQPLSRSPVQYGPSLTAGLGWSFGDPAPRASR